MIRYYAAAAIGLAALSTTIVASAHSEGAGHGHRDYAAGEPGDAAKPARTVKVEMVEEDGDKRMLFKPDRIEVKRGDQVRFVLDNAGIYAHEFLLDTPERNAKHGLAMKKNPDMEHDDPNGTRVALMSKKELVWRFSKPGTFEYACLIPGHYEAGMHGLVTVK